MSYVPDCYDTRGGSYEQWGQFILYPSWSPCVLQVPKVIQTLNFEPWYI